MQEKFLFQTMKAYIEIIVALSNKGMFILSNKIINEFQELFERNNKINYKVILLKTLLSFLKFYLY